MQRSPLDLLNGWISVHHVHRKWAVLGLLAGLMAILDVAGAVGMAYVAGFTEIQTALGNVVLPWFGATAGGIVVSFVGYFFAYRGIYHVEDGPRLAFRQMVAVVIGGFGGFLAHGGAALDDYALRAAGSDERDSSVRVSTLAGMEHGVLGVLGTGAGITVLVLGLSAPPSDFSIPWSVIPLPGFAVAFWLAERYRGRFHGKSGWRSKLATFLDSIHLNRLLFLRPRDHAPAVLGMAVFWIGDAFAMWSALRGFGFGMEAAALFIGFATGMVFTRRTGPLAGAGVLMVVLPVTIWYSGSPLAIAVVGVFAYRVISVWLPMPFAFASLPTLRSMGESGTPHAEDHAESDEPALRRKSA